MYNGDNEQVRRENLKKINEIIGEKYLAYQQKIAVLKEQFTDDSSMRRDLLPLLREDIAPMMAALVVDNLDRFKEMYDNPPIKPREDAIPYFDLQCLHMGCACASTKISNFLLKKIGLTFTSEEHEDLLDYALASKNKAWIKSIVEQFMQAKKSLPNYMYGDRDTRKILSEITDELKPENSIAKKNKLELESSSYAKNSRRKLK